MTVKFTETFSKQEMIGLGIAFIILPTVFFALRIWAKTLGRRGISLDDYTLSAALVIAIALNIIQLIAAYYGELGSHEVNAPGSELPAPDDQRFLTFEKCKFAVNILYTVGLGFAKASVLILYMNIFTSPGFQLAAKILMGVVISWSITFFLTNLLVCVPVTPLVEPFYDHGSSVCYNGVPMWYSSCATDLAIDLAILALPIRPVLKLHLPLKQKLGVLAMFLLGATVCAISATRLVIYIQAGENYVLHISDETYYTSPTFFWSTIEVSSAVICACLPTYRPLFKKAMVQTSRVLPSSKQAYGYGYDMESLRSENDTTSADRGLLNIKAADSQDDSRFSPANLTKIITDRGKGGESDSSSTAQPLEIVVERSFYTETKQGSDMV